MGIIKPSQIMHWKDSLGQDMKVNQLNAIAPFEVGRLNTLLKPVGS